VAVFAYVVSYTKAFLEHHRQANVITKVALISQLFYDPERDNPMLNQLLNSTLQRTSSCTNFQKKEQETKRRRLWINFVLAKRAKWTFTPTSHLCFEHFRPEHFESQFSAIPGTSFVDGV